MIRWSLRRSGGGEVRDEDGVLLFCREFNGFCWFSLDRYEQLYYQGTIFLLVGVCM